MAVEPMAESTDRAVLTEHLGHALRERLGITCVVRVLTPGSVPRTEVGKARWATGEPPIPGLA